MTKDFASQLDGVLELELLSLSVSSMFRHTAVQDEYDKRAHTKLIRCNLKRMLGQGWKLITSRCGPG